MHKRTSNDRANLITRNIEKIETAYVDAKKRGVKEPLVIVLDLEDPISRTIAENCAMPKDFIDKLIAECQNQEAMATTFVPMERYQAYKMFEKIQRQLHRDDARNPKQSSTVVTISTAAPKGKFWAIALSFGKNLAMLDIPE